MKMSVVICSYNPRGAYLERVLLALQEQTLPQSEWELLMVDNASSLPLAGRIDLSWHPNARHLLEPKLGKLHAWLLAMRECHGQILVFVDDDNVLARDFLEQTLKIAAEFPFVGAWGGSAIPEYEAPLPSWVGEQVWRLSVIEVKNDVWSNLREGFETKPAGAGLCIRRPVADRYMQWCRENEKSQSLDRSGGGLGGYGDMDLCQCAIDVGLGTGRFARLKLVHLISANRLTLDYFLRHAEGDAISYLTYRAIRGLPYREFANYSWWKEWVWRLHCLRKHVCREQREIHIAHYRGLKRGVSIADQILAQNNSKD